MKFPLPENTRIDKETARIALLAHPEFGDTARINGPTYEIRILEEILTSNLYLWCGTAQITDTQTMGTKACPYPRGCRYIIGFKENLLPTEPCLLNSKTLFFEDDVLVRVPLRGLPRTPQQSAPPQTLYLKCANAYFSYDTKDLQIIQSNMKYSSSVSALYFAGNLTNITAKSDDSIIIYGDLGADVSITAPKVHIHGAIAKDVQIKAWEIVIYRDEKTFTLNYTKDEENTMPPLIDGSYLDTLTDRPLRQDTDYAIWKQ